jgi:DUF4097 and DUF4098 domain-containing protein YvlB
MNKYFQKRVIAVLLILCAEVLFTGCGFRYIVNSSTNTLKRADGIDFTVEKANVEPITKIDINTGMAEVELIQSDNFYVEIDYLYWEEAPEYTLENGVLYFDDSDCFPNSYSINFNLDNTIKIYLPEATALTKLLIENSSGDVILEGFTAEDMNVRVSYGNFTLKEAAAAEAEITLSSGNSRMTDFQVGRLDFTNSYGNAKFTNINTGDAKLPDGVTYQEFKLNMSSGNVNINGLTSSSIGIRNSYGDVTCEEVIADEFDLDLSSGRLEVGNADLQDIDVTNSYGDVTLNLLGSEEDYSYDLSTSYGNINVGNKSYEDHLNKDNNGTRNVNADLSSGDVEINFQ